MALRDQLQTDLNGARKARDAALVLVLGTALSDVKNADIKLGRDATDDDVIDVLRGGIKRRRESAEMFTKGNRPELAEKENTEAQVLEVVEEDSRYIVSVRFTGSLREQLHADTEDLDEVWHLTKPRSGFGGWVVAGIQQVTPGA